MYVALVVTSSPFSWMEVTARSVFTGVTRTVGMYLSLLR